MSDVYKDDALIDQNIAVYLDGGWSLTGTVKKADKDKIFIENNEDFFMVYRNKISAVCLNFDIKRNKANDIKNIKQEGESTPIVWPGEQVGGAPSGGLSIPIDMLTEEAQDSYEDNNLSVYFNRAGLKNDDAEDGSRVSFSEKAKAYDDTK